MVHHTPSLETRRRPRRTVPGRITEDPLTPVHEVSGSLTSMFYSVGPLPAQTRFSGISYPLFWAKNHSLRDGAGAILAMGRVLQHGSEQPSGVLALGIVDDIGGGTDLDDTVLAHDHHAIADLADQSQVMTDE